MVSGASGGRRPPGSEYRSVTDDRPAGRWGCRWLLALLLLLGLGGDLFATATARGYGGLGFRPPGGTAPAGEPTPFSPQPPTGGEGGVPVGQGQWQTPAPLRPPGGAGDGRFRKVPEAGYEAVPDHRFRPVGRAGQGAAGGLYQPDATQFRRGGAASGRFRPTRVPRRPVPEASNATGEPPATPPPLPTYPFAPVPVAPYGAP